MRRFTLSQMVRLPMLADLIMPSYRDFYPERLITTLGLYEAVLIDTASIQVYDMDAAGEEPHLEVSRDVKALHRFINLKDRIMLPCPDCRQNQPFDLRGYFNPRKVTTSSDKPTFTTGKTPRIPVNPSPDIYAPVDDRTGETHNIFDPPSVPKYRIGQNYLRDFDQTQFQGVDFDDYKYQCAIACVDGIAEQLGEIRRDFFCTLDNLHRGFVDFIIYEAVDRYMIPPILQRYEARKAADPKAEMTEEEAKAAKAYDQLKTCLIMLKVGQFPSMADLQMFSIEKYRKVLDKEHFRDLKTALGLYASGVGCGSFVYLRRIFEGLVSEAAAAASQKSGWDSEEFKKQDFNQKIDYLDAFGFKLIPEELNAVRTRIYGILSRGIHASSDQECIELFEPMEYVIEELLDHKISKMEREEKIKKLGSVLSNVK